METFFVLIWGKLISTATLTLGETLVWGGIVGTVVGISVNLITPTIFDLWDAVRERFTHFRKKLSYQGIYDCEYFVPWKSGKESIFYERILLIKQSRNKERYIGYLINNNEDAKFEKVNKPQIRVECELLDGNYLIGRWQHPDPNNRTHGCFMLDLDERGLEHLGLWSGRSTTYNRILSGKWVWKRNKKGKLEKWKFIFQRLIG